MAKTEPLPCWCGNMPSLPPWQDGVNGNFGWQSYGCYNHPTKHPRHNKTTNTVEICGKNLDLDGLIIAWNEKVRKHNEVERKKMQKCSCGTHIRDKWNFCPSCGKAVANGDQ